jgi:hypothetical protein
MLIPGQVNSFSIDFRYLKKKIEENHKNDKNKIEIMLPTNPISDLFIEEPLNTKKDASDFLKFDAPSMSDVIQ